MKRHHDNCFLFGLITGVVLGFFYAPKSGRDIRKALHLVVEEKQPAIDKTKGNLEDYLKKKKEQLENMAHELSSKIEGRFKERSSKKHPAESTSTERS